jgi:hypothetical protein
MYLPFFAKIVLLEALKGKCYAASHVTSLRHVSTAGTRDGHVGSVDVKEMSASDYLNMASIELNDI